MKAKPKTVARVLFKSIICLLTIRCVQTNLWIYIHCKLVTLLKSLVLALFGTVSLYKVHLHCRGEYVYWVYTYVKALEMVNN